MRNGLLLAIGLSVLSLGLACGSIANPEGSNLAESSTSTVSGALTGGSSLDGLHVGLVWRVGNQPRWAVGGDAVVVNGHFAINISVPSPDIFRPYTAYSDDPPPSMSDASGDAGISKTSIKPLDQASGDVDPSATLKIARERT